MLNLSIHRCLVTFTISKISKSLFIDYFIFRLSDLCDKTRKQCHDIEHKYENFRLKQFVTHFFPKQVNSSVQSPDISTSKITKLRRSRSFNINSTPSSPSSSNSSTSSNLFDLSSGSVFKTHLTELKTRVHSLKSDCSILNEKLHQSEEEKRYLLERITYLERQRRDDNDSLQNELNHYKKLLEKQSNEKSVLSNIYSTPEHEVSLYDEVLLENKQSISKSYEPTNYKDLFSRVYEKLKISNNNKNDI